MTSLPLALGLLVLGCALIVAGIAAYDLRLGAIIAGALLAAAGLLAVRVDE